MELKSILDFLDNAVQMIVLRDEKGNYLNSFSPEEMQEVFVKLSANYTGRIWVKSFSIDENGGFTADLDVNKEVIDFFRNQETKHEIDYFDYDDIDMVPFL